MNTKTYKPGELAPVSGQYQVQHSTDCNISPQREVYLAGSIFPRCGICGAALDYNLLEGQSPVTNPGERGNFIDPAS